MVVFTLRGVCKWKGRVSKARARSFLKHAQPPVCVRRAHSLYSTSRQWVCLTCEVVGNVISFFYGGKWFSFWLINFRNSLFFITVGLQKKKNMLFTLVGHSCNHRMVCFVQNENIVKGVLLSVIPVISLQRHRLLPFSVGRTSAFQERCARDLHNIGSIIQKEWRRVTRGYYNKLVLSLWNAVM